MPGSVGVGASSAAACGGPPEMLEGSRRRLRPPRRGFTLASIALAAVAAPLVAVGVGGCLRSCWSLPGSSFVSSGAHLRTVDAAAAAEAGRRRGQVRRFAGNPWDFIFGGAGEQKTEGADPNKYLEIDTPSSTEELVQGLQDIMMTSVEKALPRMDIDLPPGLMLGIDNYTSALEPPEDGDEELTPKGIALADRELAAAWAMMFHGLKNPKNLCILFRTEKLAFRARKAWGILDGIRVASFPDAKGMQDPVQALAKAIDRRIFVIAVAPKDKQLRQLRALEDQQTQELLMVDPEMEKAKVAMILIMLNARLRGQADPSDAARYWADSSNPVYHARWVGPKGEGLLFHSLFREWRLVAGGQELLRGDSEPSPEEIEKALLQVA